MDRPFCQPASWKSIGIGVLSLAQLHPPISILDRMYRVDVGICFPFQTTNTCA